MAVALQEGFTDVRLHVLCSNTFFVLDKIVIQLYSRIFELRLCMLLDNKYWVAKISDKPENCNIKLAFFEN